MVVIGDEIAMGIIDRLLKVGFDYLADQMEWQTGMKSELRRLKDALPHIQAVVDASEGGQLEMKGPLLEWLRQLKDALYDAEDVLEELDYPRLQRLAEEEEEGPIVEGSSNKGKGKVKVKIRALLSDTKNKVLKIGKRAVQADPSLKALRAVVKRLDDVASHVGEFLQLLSTATTQQQPLQGQTQAHIFQVAGDNRETGSLLTESKLFGRVQQREELHEWLMTTANHFTDDDNHAGKNISLASIIGHGGMGKTTLVQSVLGEDEIQRHFDLKVRVCVSTPFSVKALTRSILESATGKSPKAESLDLLQDALRKKLLSSNKPVLVVLDDVWNDSNVDGCWESLLAPLRHGLPKGSKILVTIRMQSVADVVEEALRVSTGYPSKRFQLTPLPEADFLSLFNCHAFGGLDPDNYMNLQRVGEQIAARLGGLPLAAKVVGRMLNSRMRKEFWETILNNSIFNFEDGEKGVMSVLRLSYYHLSKHLRPCFAYCSVFPQDHVFKKDDLVHRWMAVGLIHQPSKNSTETLEDIGGHYFDDLVKRSFLEPNQYSLDCYIMHDLLHELAESASAGECFRFEGQISVEQISKSVRHLYFKTYDVNQIALLAAMEWLDNLRTLHLIGPQEGYLKHDSDEGKEEEEISGKLWRKIFRSTRHLRILDVDGFIAVLDELSSLKHLRFLSISSTKREFPAICNYNIQTIRLPRSSFKSYGQILKNLINLRHYEPRSYKLHAVGKLTSLQELHFVIVKEREFKVAELKDLNQVRELEISGLVNVTSHGEARAAELSEKKHLRRLHLNWTEAPPQMFIFTSRPYWVDRQVNPESEELVLDGLQPHSNIENLSIHGYGGSRPAAWMKPELMDNLQYVELINCMKLEHLGPLGRLSYLKSLYLQGMTAVKELNLDGGFRLLETLSIIDFKNVEDWSGFDAWDGQCFPCLCELTIKHCPKLKVLPSLPLCFRRLELDDVGLTALPKLVPHGRGSNSGSCSIRNSVDDIPIPLISISNCLNLTSANGFLQHYCFDLKRLTMNGCKLLEDLQAPAQVFRHLEDLTINGCDKLFRSLPIILQGASTCLLDLRIESGSIMTSLPSQEVWGSLASLEILSISGCPVLSSLEPLKALRCRLGWLRISDCPMLVHAASTMMVSTSDEENPTFAVDNLSIGDPLLLLVEPLRKLNSVRMLTIKNCDQLVSMMDVWPWLLRNHTSLEYLYMYRASSLQSLPVDFQLLSSLAGLSLFSASQLQSLPPMPRSLGRLEIPRCIETLRERCREDDGADWPNIKHIPDRLIHVSLPPP